MRVLFWGTPEFALPSLHAVVEGHELVGVVTQPDRPAGRGRSVRPGPVKQFTAPLGVPILQPETARGPEFPSQLRGLRPDISVVAAFGQILTDEVLNVPPKGSINVHASLLPELRGAAPINWAIIRGHETTGVTIMRMVREMDAGPILRQLAIEIGPRTTAGELYQELSELGARALRETLEALESGPPPEREQDHDRATFAPKLTRDDARLDWSLPAAEVTRWIRGCDPWPAAWSELDGRRVQLFEPAVEEREAGSDPGRVLEASPRRGLLVATGADAVRIGAVKPAGRGRMATDAWIRGRGVRESDRLV